MMNPIGPETPAVYWRRRLLVALGVVVVLILVFVLFSGGSNSDGGQPVAATTAPSSSPSPVLSGGTGSPSASPSGSGSDSPSPSATSSDVAALPDCNDSDIVVTAKVDTSSYKVGTPITFKMEIANNSETECKRNVGPKVNTITVSSGGVHVWSSDDCSPAGGDQIVSIPPQKAWGVQATWDQKLTASGCPTNLGNAKSGSYDVTAQNNGSVSAPQTFTLV